MAVSAALMERKRSALPRALAMLALGHFLAMLAILLDVGVGGGVLGTIAGMVMKSRDG